MTTENNISFVRTKAEVAFYLISKYTNKENAEIAEKDVVSCILSSEIEVHKKCLLTCEHMESHIGGKNRDSFTDKGALIAYRARIRYHKDEIQRIEDQKNILQLI